MNPKKPARFLTVADVVHDHGGETAFWSAYLSGRLAPEVRSWIAAQSETDPSVRSWLAVVEGPEARPNLRRALEAVNYLVDVEAEASEGVSGTDDELTTLVQETPPRTGSPPYRERLRQCLFQLLDEVEIRLPADSEAREATALVDALVGAQTVRAFGEITAWLRSLRRRSQHPTPLDRLLAVLVPELFERDGDWRYQLSFRLFLRERFRRHAEKRGFRPQGPRFHDLDSAFDHLTRQRIGELARTAAADPDAGELLQGWQLAYAEFAAEVHR